MQTEIINIGDELLIGQVVNTNAAWMAEQLNLAGFVVNQVTMIRDDRVHILEALKSAQDRVPIVLISGGIGPTKDDITKHTLCAFFGTSLVFDPEAYKDIEDLFARRGYQVTELNRLQAELPANCRSIPNPNGTARGMWFEKENAQGTKTIFISMPGVPFEMKAMMTDHVIPGLREIFHTPAIVHRTVLTQGIGESFLAAKIESWEESLPAYIKLAYLPQPGIVRLRLTGKGPAAEILRLEIEEKVRELQSLIGEHIFGYDDDSLETVVGKLLTERQMTIATAESCTGGYIAHLITSVPGSSAYFKGSLVPYSNEIKTGVAGILNETIRTFGAVSQPVVEEMAISVQTMFGVDYSIAISGIAGPQGGTPEKPVGTTWIAVASPGSVTSQKFLFGDSRERNIRRAALQALNILRKTILAEE
jgi:nicotinamide-nucleotide amidase